MTLGRPVWAEISLSHLRHNFHFLRATLAGTAPAAELLAVVKANAYGHGLELCGPALAAAGARWLGVTSVEEGTALRRALGVLPSHLPAPRILVMSSLWESEADTVLDRGLTPQIWEPYQLALLAEAAAHRSLGPASVPVHLEIDTGMARQGVAPGPPLAALLGSLHPGSPIAIEGVMTHFSAPEQLAGPDTNAQIARFTAALHQLAAAGIHPAWVHAGNSATTFDPHAIALLASLAAQHGAKLMLRPGLALYGYSVHFTPPEPARLQAGLRPVLAWKTRITSLRDLPPGAGVGYNSIFRAARPTRLALIPVGYGDGLNRLLSNPTPTPASAMLVRDRPAPVAGRISMDQTLLDVTDIANTAVGDEVIILGESATSGVADNAPPAITARDHADLCRTIPYEILCNIAARVPRLAMD